MKILSVVGARPQFVKAAVVSRAIAAAPSLSESIVHTGQHYDHGMSRVFFDEMDIPEPVVDLGVGSGPHGARTGAMLAGLEAEIVARGPDLVLLYGDTDSTLAGALAASKLGVRIAHVEAGLRSFDRRMPEEVNRVVADRVADVLFCPSAAAARNLRGEGITAGVHVVGDVMIDALRHHRARAIAPRQQAPFALATVHRAENTDDPRRLAGLFAALAECPLRVVVPLHPRTARAIERHGIALRGSVVACAPLSYFEMLGHLAACEFVLTDSGGLQKEAFASGKRCLTLRETTEWVELVECGANRVVGTEPEHILAAIGWARAPAGAWPAVYGDGHAGEAIAGILAGSG